MIVKDLICWAGSSIYQPMTKVNPSHFSASPHQPIQLACLENGVKYYVVKSVVKLILLIRKPKLYKHIKVVLYMHGRLDCIGYYRSVSL